MKNKTRYVPEPQKKKEKPVDYPPPVIPPTTVERMRAKGIMVSENPKQRARQVAEFIVDNDMPASLNCTYMGLNGVWYKKEQVRRFAAVIAPQLDSTQRSYRQLWEDTEWANDDLKRFRREWGDEEFEKLLDRAEEVQERRSRGEIP